MPKPVPDKAAFDAVLLRMLKTPPKKRAPIKAKTKKRPAPKKV